MSQYYLMAQLPSLDAVGENTPLPITQERFFELCERLLSKKETAILSELTLSPKIDFTAAGNALVDKWCEGERQLRVALANVRASKMNKTVDIAVSDISMQQMIAARAAADMSDPMAAELFLNRYRLDFLEELRPADTFCVSAVYYYGLKLMLLSRIRKFDAESGEREYKKIYNSIVNGEKQETEQ